MSVRISSLIWESDRPSSQEKLVLLALADWADDDGRCSFTVQEIASKVRLENAEALAVLRSLNADGVLRAIHGAPGWHQIVIDRLMCQTSGCEVSR